MVDQDRVVAALPSYEIGSELGRGACGVVLAGRHRQLGRQVAIKQLPRAFGADPEVRKRFLAEARVLATLDHPHIVAIYDFVDYEGLCLLVMERLTGGTVWSRFHAGGFTPDVSCAILLAVCAGLQHAHEHGVLHRDVKPENLMFSGEGTLKVTDLGIAKVIGGSSTLATRYGEILGTPAYIAPEQAQGYELTPATDVYAAGTLFYELLAGRLPFPADSDPATILYRHVHELPPPLMEVAHAIPADLAAVSDRAVSRSPTDRYQSAEDFGVAIAECAARIWGRGWLGRTKVPVSASGPILTAALGDFERDNRPNVPIVVQSAPTNAVQEPVAGDFVPIQQLHPEYRDNDTLPPEAAANRAPTIAQAPAADAPPPVAPSAPVSSAAGSGSSPAGSGSVPPPSGAERDGQGGAEPSARRSRRRLLSALAALVIIGALVGVAVAVNARSNSHPKSDGSKPKPQAVGAGKNGGLWQVLPHAPTARQQVATAELNGTLWVLGGLTTGSSTNKVEGYDPAIQTWTTGPELPLPLHHAMAVSYHGQVVVMGGWFPSHGDLEGGVSKRVWALQDGKWTELPPMHHARAAGAAAVVGDKIVVAGGQANEQLVGATEVFDGKQWTDVARMPTLRDHLDAVSDGRYFYAVGGRALSSDKNSSALERYDPTTDQWLRLPAMPTARGGLGAAIVGNELVAAGGESPTGLFGKVEAFDVTAGKWSTLPPMKTPRHGLALFATGKTLYAIDGAVAAGHTHSVDTNEALDLSGWDRPLAWRTLEHAPTARQQIAATTSNGTLWVMGGLTAGTSTAKVEGFDPAIKTWTTGPPLPFPLHHAMAVSYDGDLVVLGGWIPSHGDLEADVSRRVWALRDGTWVELPPLHHARAAGAAGVVGNKIVVTGGQANHQLVPFTEVFDGKHWTDVAPMPTLRDHLAGASDGRYFYAVGGRALSSDKNSGAVERYDPAIDLWQRLPDLPTPRGGLGAAIIGNVLVTAGGESPTGVFSDVEALDLSTDTWSLLPPMKTPRHGLALLRQGPTLYAIDGAVAPGHTQSVDTDESFNLSTAASG